MASQSIKKTAAANIEILKQTHLLALIVNLCVIVILFLFKRPASFIPYVVFSCPSFFCQYTIEKSARPVYSTDKVTGQRKLLKAGDDVKHEGLYEYMFDTMYITWVLDILMVIFGTNSVWWLYSIIPGFAIFKVAGIVKGFTGSKPKPEDTEEHAVPEKSKRQTKREASKKKSRYIH